MKTKLITLCLVSAFLVSGCVIIGTQTSMQPLKPQEVVITIKAAEQIPPIEVKTQSTEDVINKTMQIQNQEGTLSNLSFILKDEAYVKIFSALTVADVTNMWNDICILYKTTDIRTLNLFINSPGGDAFSGLALADKIEWAKSLGFTVIAQASGIVASAAVPVFAVCDKRIASIGTIFMVHETAIWKWPGRETASDIRSQNKLMNLLRDRYLNKLELYSNLTQEEWEKLEAETTWFSAEKAKSWGLVDEIIGNGK